MSIEPLVVLAAAGDVSIPITPESRNAIELFMAIAAGLGLSAAAGFRVFIPLLVMSIGAQTGQIDLGSQFQWLTSTPAMLILATASLAEIGGYYIPWIDNLLDTIATPAALISGTLASAAVFPEMPEALKWACAAITGGGAAGIIQTGTVLLRGASSATTGGLGNPVISTGEAGGSVATSILAIIIPPLVLILFVLAAWFIFRHWRKRRKAMKTEPNPTTSSETGVPPGRPDTET